MWYAGWLSWWRATIVGIYGRVQLLQSLKYSHEKACITDRESVIRKETVRFLNFGDISIQ